MHKILVAIDNSSWSVRALITAIVFAETLQAEVWVLHVLEQPESESDLSWLEPIKAKWINDRHQLMVLQGEPVSIILEQAERMENDLLMVVLATHGMGGNLSKLMGHVPLEIVKKAQFPILLTRRNMDIPVRLRHILLPLDGSPPSACVVPTIAKFAESCGAEIHFLHVIGARHKIKEISQISGSMATPRYMDHTVHEWEAWEHEFLERFFQPRKHVAGHIPVHLFMGHGDAGSAIVSHAKKHGNDLIAMGWKGVYDEDRAMVLKEVLLNSPCPLLIFHSPNSIPGETCQI